MLIDRPTRKSTAAVAIPNTTPANEMPMNAAGSKESKVQKPVKKSGGLAGGAKGGGCVGLEYGHARFV